MKAFVTQTVPRDTLTQFIKPYCAIVVAPMVPIAPVVVPVDGVPPDVPTRRLTKGFAEIKPVRDKLSVTAKSPLMLTFPMKEGLARGAKRVVSGAGPVNPVAPVAPVAPVSP